MYSDYERELKYGDPKLRDLKPRELKSYEWDWLSRRRLMMTSCTAMFIS
jgi:hypothetical protein